MGRFLARTFVRPLADDANTYQVCLILAASLALIPIFWGTSLLDGAYRAPVEPASASKLLVSLRVPKPHVEAKTETDDQLAGLTPDERRLANAVLRELPGESVADVIAQIKTPTPVAGATDVGINRRHTATAQPGGSLVF